MAMIRRTLLSAFLLLLALLFQAEHAVGIAANPVAEPGQLTHNETADEQYRQQPTKRALPAWQFYYDVDSATHQTNYNRWYAAGYRMISISVYGTPPAVRYAAVWVQRSGPPWIAIHNADSATYYNWVNTNAPQGYYVDLVSVTGPRTAPIFAGVMVAGGLRWYQRCDQTLADYEFNSKTFGNDRLILKAFREYGTSSDRRYCAVWHQNGDFNQWSYWITQNDNSYQNRFNGETDKPYWRPASVALSDDQLISSLFTDTWVGKWTSRHGMTAATLQSAYNTELAAGRYIISLQGGGPVGSARFAAVWAEQDLPQPRQWATSEGIIAGFKDNAAAVSTIGGLMKTFMQKHGVRQASLAINLRGTWRLAIGYTWSEMQRPLAATSHRFLLASVSKMYCAAAIQALYTAGRLTPTTKVYPRLGYTNPGDARLNDITVQQLIDHTGGLDRAVTNFDAVFAMREIALAQSTGTRPATKQDVVDYMFRKPLDFTPGARVAYSNYGYLLLSHLVERVTGQDYLTYLRSAVPDTCTVPSCSGLTLWATAKSAHVNDPITQESVYTGLSALDPRNPYSVASVFGGDSLYKESCVGPSSLAASAATIAWFIRTNAVQGNGGRRVGRRDGSMPGSSSWVESRADGVDWALVVNTRDWAPPYPQNQWNNTDNDWFRLVREELPAFFNTNPFT
ncbi:MAG: hypothetical protein M1817_003379 [Caeruleum heppii]|nr:MAG: hypothetical protein M1817_003379 [Caeruleum heppii]